MNPNLFKKALTGIILLIIAPVILLAAVYPANYNVVYHRISLTVNPGVSGTISNASVTTYFRTTAASITQIGFDLDAAMVVSTVTYHGTAVGTTFSCASNTIVITFPAAITPLNTLDSVTINYSGTPVSPVTSVPSGYNYSSTYKCIYTLGEAFRGSTWWPCKDSLTDKIDSVDFIITTPSGYRAGSNGVVTEAISGLNRICTWKTRHPIASYLVNFAAADYTNYQFNATSLTHTVPVMNYLYSSTDYNASYQGYLNMLQSVMPAYCTLLNTDYPFHDEKYGTAESGSGWGALEVQSMTFIDRTSYSGGYTLAHELAHQWFGDKLTTSDWHHIWLNEGFAQYFESVIYPELLLSASTAATKRTNLKNSVSTGGTTTYVSTISTADNIFIGASSQPYEKGAMTLSMLRAWLGDANFFAALHNYLNAPGLAYNFTCVDSLQKYMQAETPNNLTSFFTDWVMQKGRATYAVKYQYVTNGVYIQLIQSQTFAGAGYFDMPVPLQLKNGSGLDTTLVVIDRGGKLYSRLGNGYNSSTIFYNLYGTPNIAPVFDPNSTVLATASSITNATLSTLITLPVSDITLSAADRNGAGQIHWKISADELLQSITLEKSNDGKLFRNIYTTDAKLSSFNQYNGDFEDDNLSTGPQYYRLKVQKKDGINVYSAIKILNINAADHLNISPNPVQQSFLLTIPSSLMQQRYPLNVSIFNAGGLLVHEQKIAPGNNQSVISSAGYSPGLYKLVLRDKKQSVQISFLKQ